MKKALEALTQSCGLIKTNPSLILPFALLALFESIALYLLFLAPQEPFSKVLAPPIIRTYGEQFIHYPGHLLKLPQLFYHAKLLLGFLPGAFLSAIVVGLAGDIKTKQAPEFLRNLKTSLKRFFALSIIWLLNFCVLKLIEFIFVKSIGWSESKAYSTTLSFIFYFLNFWGQITFIYAVPLVMLTKQNVFKALYNNFRYLKHLFLPTTLCIFLASLIYFGLYYFERDIIGLAARTSPEMIVFVLSIGIPLTFVINLLINVTSAVLFVDEQTNDPQVSLTTSEVSS